MSALSICLCTTYYPPHGSNHDALFVRDLAAALTTRGHRVTVIHHPGAAAVSRIRFQPQSTPSHPAVRETALRSRGGLVGLLALHQSGRPLGLSAGLRAALNRPFDVVHFHNVSLIGGPGVFRLGAPALRIATLNDHWLVCPTHLLWTWDGRPCRSPRCLGCCLRQRKLPQWWRSTDLMHRASSDIDAFIGPSRLTMELHRERGLRGPLVHLPGFSPAASTSPDRSLGALPQRFFLFCGNLEPHKGLLPLIEGFRRQREHRLVICGNGSMAGTIRQLTDVVPNVTLVSDPTPARLAALYRRTIATLVPTPAYQTFCHATATSFAHGTPVIGLDHGVVAEIVSAWGGGTLYRDDQAFAAALRALSEDDRLRARLAEEATRAYRRELSEDVYVSRYIALIGALRERKRHEGALSRRHPDDRALAGRPVLW